ncbi:MAG: hypothetical protein V4550_20515 [Gemmatimonadota bacterium]
MSASRFAACLTALSFVAIAGVGVFFAVASGGGSVTSAAPNTNVSGTAAVGSWTPGSANGTSAELAQRRRPPGRQRSPAGSSSLSSPRASLTYAD